MVPVRQHLVQEAIIPLISLLPIVVRQEVRVGLFPAKVSPAAKFAANARLRLVHRVRLPLPVAAAAVVRAGHWEHRLFVRLVIPNVIPALKNPVLLVLSRALAIRPAAPKSGQPSAAFTPGMTSAELVKMPRKTAAP